MKSMITKLTTGTITVPVEGAESLAGMVTQGISSGADGVVVTVNCQHIVKTIANSEKHPFAIILKPALKNKA